MLKLVGSLCILAGCIGWGANRIGEEKSRIRHLQEWIRIIRRIQNEIAYGKRTLPEICLLLSESCPEPYRECFGAIYEQAGRQEGEGLEQIWQRQVAQCLSAVRLSVEEKEILKCLPLDPGIQEEKFQAERIGQSMDLLTRKCRQAEDAYENKARVTTCLSILAGVFMTILLL